MVQTAIVNVVVTAALNQRLYLEELGKLREILHDPEIYGGIAAYFRSPEIKGTVSIFASGKMISIGTKSEGEAARGLEYVKDFLIERGFIKPTMLKPRLQNIVITVDFGETIEIEQLARNHKIIYEPEQFPGGIIRIKEPYKATAVLFASGKAIVTGFKSYSQINPTLQRIISLIKINPS